MKYNPESAERYVQGRGDEFRRDLFNKKMTQRAMAEKHGTTQSWICILRKAVVPREQRRSPHEVTPEMLAAFKSSATSKKLAKRFKISYNTLERLRRRHIGTRISKELRLTPSAMALLRSKFSNVRVGKALGYHAATVWEWRIKLGIRKPTVKTVITEEQRAILKECASRYEAAKRLGMSVDRIKRWHFLVQEGYL
jgi:transcriptional regulator with XRE-family HTH domain